jgi:predicted permease
MVLNHILPVFALVILGAVLKHCRMTGDEFLKTSDRLNYFIFFPAMLFWKIGRAEPVGSIPLDYLLAVICAILAVYLLSTLYIVCGGVGRFQAGSFSQSCYRFNTYVALAIILNLLGEEGVTLFGLLIGFAIPIINVLAVSTLIWFSDQTFAAGQKIRLTAKSIVSNPLIIGCLAGIAYSRWGFGFAAFLDNTLRLASTLTLPLALLSIGGTLTFQNLRDYLTLSLVASGFKLLLLPAIGYFFLKQFQVHSVAFQVAMLFFAMPTSTAIYVLSSQLRSDTRFASAAIVLSTIFSFFTLSAVMWMI